MYIYSGYFFRGLYGNTTPLLGLVGVTVASGSILSKDEELEGICWEIRVSFI